MKTVITVLTAGLGLFVVGSIARTKTMVTATFAVCLFAFLVASAGKGG
jgi:hypothetical protein